jgi:DNA-binding transcriptional LysR family regulator
VLPRAVAGFRRRHPQVQVHVQALHTPQVVSALLLQEADVGFVISSSGQPALEHELLAEVDMFCVCPRDCCRLRACAPKAWNSRIWPICLWSRSMRDPLGMRLGQACREHGVGLSPVVTVQTYHAALSMAEYGLGAAIMDGCTALAADRRQVHVVPLLPRITVGVNALSLPQRRDRCWRAP